MLKNLGSHWIRPRYFFSPVLMSFVRMQRVSIEAKFKSVALPIAEIIAGM